MSKPIYKLTADEQRSCQRYRDQTHLDLQPPIIELINILGGRLTLDNAIEYFYWTQYYEKENCLNERVR